MTTTTTTPQPAAAPGTTPGAAPGTDGIPDRPAAETIPAKKARKRQKKQRHSTKHYRVDIDRAETLSGTFPALSPVEIRECLEGAPLKQAVGLINWAGRSDRMNPYGPLKNWARKNRRGFYSEEVREIDNNEHYRRCMLYIRRKEAEMLEKSGRRLFQSERETLAQRYYAPRYRAETEDALSYAAPEGREAV